MTEVWEIILMAAPWAVAVGYAIYAYVKRGQLINVTATAEKVKNVLNEVLAFFDVEKPMAETSLETIQNVIPAATYKMTEESCNRILATCASEEEKERINSIIYDYENPKVTGDECCVYTIETTGAIFQVSYGVPELIEAKNITTF